MAINKDNVRMLLKQFDFKNLFIEELGWDNFNVTYRIDIQDNSLELKAVAEKRGVQVFICQPDKEGKIPNHLTRRKIEVQLTKLAHEHLIIYIDKDKSLQKWQWVARAPGKPAQNREIDFYKDQSGEALYQKLSSIAFDIEEEDALTLTDVTIKLRDALDRDKVTKKFYIRFKQEMEGFIKFINGIPTADWDKWYASVTINRLMFIYFLQKKGFLNNDHDYLKNKLKLMKTSGKDKYYREFLCPLFFQGFALKETQRDPKIRTLLGKIPYLNGGLFVKHKIEEAHGETIQIPDDAFAKLFAFFDQYQWHLDDRPLQKDNEINPEVLGYIFEKYTNQKQMGAYYTKEDITDYIGKNTIIPYLLDEAKRNCKIAFEPDGSVWRLLKADPDRYIYPAVRKGVIDDSGEVIPESVLPDFVQTGMYDPKARMFDKRYNLGDARGNVETLPTETWREYVERRKRCLELRAKLIAGEVHDVNDLITYNLNIRQFAQDVVESCEGPELLRAIWKAIREVSVLDPTCGSGAFLFAALSILEPLYDACLARMQAFVEELDASGTKHSPEKFSDFRKVLAQIGQHPNRRYFILKSIIINNLYGVDIMDEAVEICKLRFFLKLVAQLESPDNIEPLPDIDFNIRAGNTLVGYATAEDVKKAMTGTSQKQSGIPFKEGIDAYNRFVEKLENVKALVDQFRLQQNLPGGEITTGAKDKLNEKLKVVEEELNRYLATEYGIDSNKKAEYKLWLESHKPFHWFVEFYGIMRIGGFDAIIGNPPYVQYRQPKIGYLIRELRTSQSGNLYAFCVETGYGLVKQRGRFGMIIPIASVSTDGMNSLQAIVQANRSWVSHFAVRPGKLFDGVDMNLTILLSQKVTAESNYSSMYYRWRAGKDSDRDSLFQKLSYQILEEAVISLHSHRFPKLGSMIESMILQKLLSSSKHVRDWYAPIGKSIYYHSGGRYWRKALLKQLSSHYKGIQVNNSVFEFVFSLLNSQLFYWYWITNSNCMDVVSREVDLFPALKVAPDSIALSGLNKRLLDCYYSGASTRQRRGEIIDTDELNFDVRLAKPILDEIDQVLAQHYGFTDEELDFIINYDIKYRMGRNAGNIDAD